MNHEKLQELFERAAGAQFGGDFKQLMQFVGLSVRRGIEFGVRDGDGAKAGNCRYQRFLLSRKCPFPPGINQDRTLGALRAQWRGDQHAGSDQIAE